MEFDSRTCLLTPPTTLPFRHVINLVIKLVSCWSLLLFIFVNITFHNEFCSTPPLGSESANKKITRRTQEVYIFLWNPVSQYL